MGFEQVESGLGIDDVVAGGGALAKAGDRVSVHYTGWLWQAGHLGNRRWQGGRQVRLESSDRDQPFSFAARRPARSLPAGTRASPG